MLDSEVTLLWPSRWNTTKVLYLLARYLPLVDTSIILYCKFIAIREFIQLIGMQMDLAMFQQKTANHYMNVQFVSYTISHSHGRP